jgi:putative spermidine/putrescine transport system permease protein
MTRVRVNPTLAVLWGFVALVVAFILAPLLVVIASSLTTTGYLAFPPEGLTLKWYPAILDNPTFTSSFITSIELAACVVAVSVPAGVLASYAINRSRSRTAHVLEQVFLSPLMLPAVVFGLGLLFVLSASGWRGSFLGGLLAHVIVASPFVIRASLAGFRAMDPQLEEASRSLGAGPIRTFFTVTLPTVAGSVASGAIFAFVISFDEAVVTLFLIGPDFETLPVTIFTYVQYSNDPTVAAVSAVLVVASALLVGTVMRLTGGSDER